MDEMNINIPKYAIPDRYAEVRCCECGAEIKSLPGHMANLAIRCSKCELKHETTRGHAAKVLNALYKNYIPCVSRKDMK